MNTTTLAANPPPFSVWKWLSIHRQSLALPIMFLLAMVIFTCAAPSFLTSDNLTNILRQSVYLLIVALGQLVVLIVGGLDLSVGALVSLTSVLSALTMAAVYAAYPESQWLAIAAGAGVGIATGVITGLVNGLGNTWLRIPPFMMTLGASSLLSGLALMASGGVPIYGLPPAFGEIFGFGEFMGLPIPALVAMVVVAVLYFVLEWTRFGRHLYATGGNVRAAELSGVRTRQIIVAAFVLSSVLAVISGFLLTARLDTGESNVGMSMPLESIAACVIAGVSLAGGRGRALSVLLGTLLIVLVQNGLNLMQVGAYAQIMAVGLILIVAMAISSR